VNKRNLHLLLLLISWTVSSAQTQGLSHVSKDTSRCYTPNELRAIALKLVSGAECNDLLKVAKLTITTQDTVIKSQDKTILIQENRYKSTERLVKEKDIEITGLKKEAKKAKRKLIATQIAWAATGLVLTITTILALIN
jgi:hypothetical protein